MNKKLKEIYNALKGGDGLYTEDIIYVGVNEINRVLLVPDKKTSDKILEVFNIRMIEAEKFGSESEEPNYMDTSKPINIEANRITALAKETIVEISTIYPILTKEDAEKLFGILVKYLNFAHNNGWQSAQE